MLARIVFILIIGSTWVVAQARLGKLKGSQLVEKLYSKSEPDRLAAFYELHKRNTEDYNSSFEQFAEWHFHTDILKCPQRLRKSPLTIIFYNNYREPTFDTEFYIKDPDSLFQRKWKPHWGDAESPAFKVYTSDGKEVTPFEGNNVLDGEMLDMNGDGVIERVECWNYGVDKIEYSDVLMVKTVEKRPKKLLSVLLNWGSRKQLNHSTQHRESN